LEKSVAMNRLSSWIGTDELEPPIETTSSGAVQLACNETGQWRGTSLFIYENDGWTVFEDLSGSFGWLSTQRWLKFAKDNDMVFAGYNDAIHVGELIFIENGTVTYEFRFDEENPKININNGKPPAIIDEPLETWVEAASFVDEDSFINPKIGHLWIFKQAG
jgi:hypothetical protein